MGIYYSSISKRKKNIDGIEVAFMNFYGKAPSIFAESTRHWDAFTTRAANTADKMKDTVKYVMGAKDAAEIRKYGYCDLYDWFGEYLLHDNFKDKNWCGAVFYLGRGKYEIRFGKAAQKLIYEMDKERRTA